MSKSQILFAILLLIYLACLIYAGIATWRISRNIGSKDGRKRYLYPILAFGFVIVLDRFLAFSIHRAFGGYSSDVESIIQFVIDTPLQIIRAVVPVIIGVISARYLFFSIQGPGNGNPRPVSDPDLELAVSTVFNSSQFLTALGTSLPVGKHDKEYGLDYIPFLLQSLERRRERFENSSNWFLAATVLFGLVSAGVIASSGYYVINEVSVGAPRILKESREELNLIEGDLAILNRDTFSNKIFKKTVLPRLQLLESAKPGLNSAVQEVIRDKVAQTRSDGNLMKLLAALKEQRPKLKATDTDSKTYVKLFDAVQASLDNFKKDQSSAMPRLNQAALKLDKVISDAEKETHTRENSTAELLKRLSLGLIVSTFFLAILRYMGNLYKEHHDQRLQAERDEFSVRQFYITFKASEGVPEQRAAILNAFAPKSGTSAPAGEAKSDETVKASIDIVKEIFSTLSKKL